MSYTFNKKLVEQLRNGEICAYFNQEEDSLDMLQALLDTAFPKDLIETMGIFKYYWGKNNGLWAANDELALDKTPIPLSDFVQPEQSERDVMAELDKRLKKLEDIVLLNKGVYGTIDRVLIDEFDSIKPSLTKNQQYKTTEASIQIEQPDPAQLVGEPEIKSNTSTDFEYCINYSSGGRHCPTQCESCKSMELADKKEQQPEPKWTPKVGEWAWLDDGKQKLGVVIEFSQHSHYCTVNDQNGIIYNNIVVEWLVKPTDKEVEDYMVGLAKEKYPIGCKIKSTFSDRERIVTVHDFSLAKDGSLYSGKLFDGDIEVWSAKKQQWAEIVNPVRWRADFGKDYFFLTSGIKILPKTELNSYGDNNNYNCGNYFQTTQQAEEMAVLMQFTLNNPDKVKKLMNDGK